MWETGWDKCGDEHNIYDKNIQTAKYSPYVIKKNWTSAVHNEHNK